MQNIRIKQIIVKLCLKIVVHKVQLCSEDVIIHIITWVVATDNTLSTVIYAVLHGATSSAITNGIALHTY